MTTDPGHPSSTPHPQQGASTAPLDTAPLTAAPADAALDPAPLDAAPAAPRTVAKTRAASGYAFLVVGALVTLALVVFIIQNLSASPEVKFFGWGYQLPIGINMLISALAGAIITGLAGSVRILQLRRAYKRA